MDLELQFQNIFDDLTEETIEVLNKEGEAVAKETVKELKNTSPKRTGSYSKSWAIDRSKSRVGIIRYTIHNKKHYQLTHLLERPHLTRDGMTYSKAYPHIGPAEKKAIKLYVDKVKRRLKK